MKAAAVGTRAGSVRPQRKRAEAREPIGGIRFDWAFIVLGAWLQLGGYIDGWAHRHLAGVVDTFFTPWHAVFYSGFLAVAGYLVAAAIRNHARGHPWLRTIPAGYELSLLGVLVFWAGGAADMIWHILFGIEVTVEALYSPTHLALAFGSGLILTGPLRAAWRRTETDGHSGSLLLPMLISLAFLLGLFTFFTQIIHPIGHPWAAVGNHPTSDFFPVLAAEPLIQGHGPSSVDVGQAIGIGSVLVQTGLLMGVILLVVRRWGFALPLGGFALVFTLNGMLMGFMTDEQILIPVASLAGLGADLLLRGLKPSVARPGALRLFAFAVPILLYTLYFLALMLTKGIWWSVHLWTGSIVLAGIVGLLMSYLVAPPPDPAEQRDQGSAQSTEPAEASTGNTR